MSSQYGDVAQAIRSHIQRGQILQSPGSGYPPRNREDFMVTEVGTTGIRVSKLGQPIDFSVLQRVVSDARNAGGTVNIGSKQGPADPGTLERFIQDAVGDQTRRSTYVAPILVEAGIAEYIPGGGAKRIRLSANFMEG